MEKYVAPQNNNSDFRFPASHLPLQQIRQDKSQFSMPQLVNARVFCCLPLTRCQFEQPDERRKTSRPASYRTGYQEKHDVSSLSNSLKFYIRVSNIRAGTLRSKLRNGGITYFSI